jgi:hypothetical protein
LEFVKMGEIVLAIPDTHYPFAHRDHLKFLLAVKAKYKPTKVVHLGDELDFHALSNYDHDPNGHGPSGEFARGMLDLKKLYVAFPEVKACVSNHTARPFRKASQAGIPSLFLREYQDFLEAPRGWSWNESVDIDGVIYIHGEGFSGALGAIKAAQGFMQSTVIGHVHSQAGIMWNANSRHLYFGFNVGCLIDRNAYAFSYGKHMTSKPILGCGIINRGVPTFIPMLVKNSRWTGQL